ncbi:MAG: hypothetical protein IPJ65_42920 [Archangiaceae bacterium]|nr:hypothetical protein [Archangiaceae bacterium]
MIFPLPDERERYIEHGTGLGYRHGQRRNRVMPCGIYVWPDDDSRSCPREAMHGETVNCPRCIAAACAEVRR